ncbi:hypothetical protein AIOGIFDO_01503 [Candidatus Methanoperedenaceae archaeon GB37]|nr:hypothetical protein AIOGIFDO_01503 [Candidatus Methanoperedenaceae archaeon GB37]
MPEWKNHDKWAEKMGISKETSKFVNGLIDFPKNCQEFQDFCERDPSARIFTKGRPTRMTVASLITHDSGRSNKFYREIQLKFLSQKGSDHVKAYYLHQVLDYIEWWIKNYSEENLTVENILQEKRLEKKIGDPINEELQSVVKFAIQNSEEILQDYSRDDIK